MESAVTNRFGIIATADNDEPAPLVQIAGAVVVACLHNYALGPYAKIPKEFGIVRKTARYGGSVTLG
jgi:hypothetical protein